MLFRENKFRAYYLQRSCENRFSFCLAPYNAMHFSFNGKVYPCHNNNSFAYGTIGQNSLMEIWNGSNRSLYKKYLKNNKLEKVACLQCLKDIEQKNFKSVNALRYDTYAFDKNATFPEVLGFRFTDKCNLSCVMCMSHQNVRHSQINASSVYDHSFFEALTPFIKHAKYAYFLGGEPFYEALNFKVFEMFATYNPDCRIAVQTNGMIWNDRIEKLIANGKYDINISIDSLQPEIYEFIRKGAKFEKLEESIINFRKYCLANNTKFSTCITPMNINWRDIPELIDYFSLMSCDVWINKYYFPARYAIWALDAHDILMIIKLLTENGLKYNSHTYNTQQYNGFIDVLKSYHKDALIRKKQKNNLNKYLDALIKKYEAFFCHYEKTTGADMQKAYEVLNFIKQADNKKLYYYLKYLSDVFAGDKLAENFLLSDKNFIAEDVESICV